MKDDLIPIGKMAEYNHITIATLRLYDKMGLLKPHYVDPNSGYRYYDLYQNARLDMITYMKELGMSLAEIADVLRREDLTLIEDILSQKNEQIHEQIRLLRSRHDAVERAIESIERYRRSPGTGTISMEYIDRRQILAIPCAEDFYARGIKSYERCLAQLRYIMRETGLLQVHSYIVGTSIRREDFTAGKLLAHEIFAFLGRDTPRSGEKPRTLDSGMYACIYTDSFDQEEASALALLRFCREQGYRVSGDYICEVMTEFNIFGSDKRSMYLRLQVPVSFEKAGA